MSRRANMFRGVGWMDAGHWTRADLYNLLVALAGMEPMSERKARLYAVACFRSVADSQFPGGRAQRSLALAEFLAEGQGTPEEVRSRAGWHRLARRHDCLEYVTSPEWRGIDAAILATGWFESRYGRRSDLPLANLLRCVFGNPYQPVSVEPGQLTPTVESLAHAAYEERLLPSGELDPDRIGILADAMEEAGIDGGMLSHLRGPGKHARGCWVVDVLTGRA
jgi:hypothetical protein